MVHSEDVEQKLELRRFELENKFGSVGAFDVNTNTAPVTHKGKMGLIKFDGEFLIPLGKYSVRGFSEEKASLTSFKNRKYQVQIIDKNGVEINKLEDVYHIGDFKNNTVIVQKNTEMYGKYDTNWQTVIPFEYSYIENLSDNLMSVSNDKGWAIINDKNEFIVPPIFSIIQYIDFKNQKVIGYKDVGYGIFDFEGNMLKDLGNDIGFESNSIKGKHYKEHEGVIIIRDSFLGKKLSLVDTNFNVIVPFHEFLKISHINEGMVRVAGQINTQKLNASTTISNYSKCGFLNLRGEMVIPMKFDFASYFNEGVCVASINDKYGFINKEGEFVIDPIYDYCLSFNKGLAKVQIGDKFYIIDKLGNKVMKSKHY